MIYDFCLGLALGLLLMSFIMAWRNSRTDGTLRIDHSNPDKDVYRFDVDDLDKLPKKKRILLGVDNAADLSQE